MLGNQYYRPLPYESNNRNLDPTLDRAIRLTGEFDREFNRLSIRNDRTRQPMQNAEDFENFDREFDRMTIRENRKSRPTQNVRNQALPPLQNFNPEFVRNEVRGNAENVDPNIPVK